MLFSAHIRPRSLVLVVFLCAAALIISGLARAARLDSPGPQMKAVVGSGVSCDAPGWDCISVSMVPTPRPMAGQMLVAMKAASVNPVTVSLADPFCSSVLQYCTDGVLGSDGAGVVVETNACDAFRVGDEVWMVGGANGALSDEEGLYAEYAVVTCAWAGHKPPSLSFVEAGAMPIAALSSLRCLRRAGPLAGKTVVVTAGQGGTGSFAVQIAKALGASTVVTAASGAGVPFVKSLGADVVVDFRADDLFGALAADSVDVVYDNLALPGTADKALRVIRPGGKFLNLLTLNGGMPSERGKAGVTQVLSCNDPGVYFTADYDALKALVDAGEVFPRVMAPVYGFGQVPQAFTRFKAPGVLGKVAINLTQAAATLN